MTAAWPAIGERQTRTTFVAALTGIAGVVLLVWESDRTGPVALLAVALTLVSVLLAQAAVRGSLATAWRRAAPRGRASTTSPVAAPSTCG